MEAVDLFIQPRAFEWCGPVQLFILLFGITTLSLSNFHSAHFVAGMTRCKTWSPRSLLAVLPFIVFVQLDSARAKPSASEEGDTETSLKCLLRSDPPQPCEKLTGYAVPKRLLQMYESLSEDVRESIRIQELKKLTADNFVKFPVQLFLLVPSKRTEFISGVRLAELLKNNPQDLALAIKIMGILNMSKAEEFFEQLEDVKLASKVQDKIAEILVRWLPDVNSNWTFSRFRMIEKVGDPLIAHFPPHFLADLSNSEAVRWLFHFRNWLWSNLPFDTWSGKLVAAKRIWSDMIFRSAYPVHITKWTENEGRRFRYFLEGATPDELQRFTAEQLQNSRLFRVKLNKLQVRALFNVMYHDGELSSSNLTEGQLYPVALKLLPQNLQRFNITLTDFKTLFTLHDEKYSFSTAFQVLESLIAQSVFLERLKSVNPETWGNSVEHLGKFIHILPVNVLEKYNITPSSPLVLSSIDSYKLTTRQARLLTGGAYLDPSKPDMMLGQKGLLCALPSSQLATKITLPQSLLSHLLSNLPAGRYMQAATLLLRVGKLNGKTWALKSIFSNRNPNQFFERLNSQAVTTLEEDIKSMKAFNKTIKALPYNTLSALLTSQRTKLTNENILWTSDSLLSEENIPSLLGLSCNDIYAMETVDFIHIMERYNKERELVNKPFPKDLQYCSQMALINYLEKKANLQDKIADKLLDYLEPAEIAAVGGYILGNLNINDIKECVYRKHILEAIGQLSLPELIVATKEASPWKYARLLLKQYAHFHNVSPMINGEGLFGLGNLFSFLPSSEIEKINPVSFKLFMESMGDSKSKELCITAPSSLALYHVIVKSFGEPYKWTPGILATLGDMLIVVPSKMLNTIPESSWRDAADVLIDQTSYHLKLEWPGKVNHISFYQACAELLETSEGPQYKSAVHELSKRYLMAIQSQIDTVINASQLLILSKHSMKGRTERKLIRDIPLEVVHPENVVKVLDTNSDEQMGIDRVGFNEDDSTELTTGFHKLTALQSSLTNSEEEEIWSTETAFTSGVASTQSLSTVTEPSSTASYENETEISISVTLYGIEFSSNVDSVEITTSNPQSTNTASEKLIYLLNNDMKDDLHESTTLSISADKKLQITTPISEPLSVVHAEIPTISSDSIMSNSTNSHSSQDHGYGNVGNAKFNSSKDWNEANETNLNEKVTHPLTFAENEDTVFLDKSNIEKTIKRRYASLEEPTETEASHNGGNPIEQSGAVLRAVLQTNQIDSRIKVPNHTTTNIPEMEKAVEQKEHEERHLHKISCHALRAAGESATLVIDNKTIELLKSEELDDCVEILASLELDISVQKKIWNSINKDKFYENLSDLGNLLKALDVYDVHHINLNLNTEYALDNLAVLSSVVTDSHVLQELGLHFLKSNPNLRSFTTEVTIALGRILCDVLERSSHKLHDLMAPNTFLRASPTLGQMKTCPTHCLHKLAHLAMKSTEYGSLENWTAEDVATLGIIPAGLKAEHWRRLQSTGYGNNPLVGLQPSAVKFIPPQMFKELNEDQLKSLPTLSSAVVSEEQMSHLSESQQEALIRIQKEVPVLKPSTISYKSQSKASDITPAKSILLLISAALAVMTVF